MRNRAVYIKAVIPVGIIMALSIFGPMMLSKYTDAKILGQVHLEKGDPLAGGYHYRLTTNEKLYILSKALDNRDIAQSNYAASTKVRAVSPNMNNADSFAYIINYRGPSENELPSSDVLTACGAELTNLYNLGAIPWGYGLEEEAYDISLYSAVDVLEPQKSLSVWQIEYAPKKKVSNIKNTLMDAYVDAETGKLYGFSLRADQSWEKLNIDEMMDVWSQYLELGTPEPYLTDNQFIEDTPYYKKYALEGIGGEKTIVTIGYYEGINELFLKISK